MFTNVHKNPWKHKGGICHFCLFYLEILGLWLTKAILWIRVGQEDCRAGAQVGLKPDLDILQTPENTQTHKHILPCQLWRLVPVANLSCQTPQTSATIPIPPQLHNSRTKWILWCKKHRLHWRIYIKKIIRTNNKMLNVPTLRCYTDWYS